MILKGAREILLSVKDNFDCNLVEHLSLICNDFELLTSKCEQTFLACCIVYKIICKW